MSTYNTVSMACVECENMVWGCGRVSAAWVGLSEKGREIGNFTLSGEWSPCFTGKQSTLNFGDTLIFLNNNAV